MRSYLAVLLAVAILMIPWMVINHPSAAQDIIASIEQAGVQLASVIISHNPKTIAELQARYDSAASGKAVIPVKKVRILLVPGHEPDYGGAEFGSVKERDMVVELADDLRGFLSNNNRYEVLVSRNATSWSPVFLNYFKSDRDNIIAWEQAHKNEVMNLERLGLFHTVVPKVDHNNTPMDAAIRLYGIDKWADENNIDIVIHIHFNDYPGHGSRIGKYSGFAIYVPQREYDNSSTTKALADAIFSSLEKYNAVSDLPGESAGIVPDQELIAVGAYNSVDAASMLIEYGYIYEPQFTNPSLHSLAINDLAYQTYLGLQNFFEPRRGSEAPQMSVDSSVLPYKWSSTFTPSSASPTDVFALQTALIEDGDYPPAGRSLNDCPRSGKFGACTIKALATFQNKNNVIGESGKVGAKTLEALNRKFNVGAVSLR